MITKIFYASRNDGKTSEVKTILEPLGIEVVSALEYRDYPDVGENGSSFYENAFMKAEAGFSFSGLPTLAEDAGIEVLSLNNEPGIYSSRYKGNIPQSEKNLDIIARLDAMPDKPRTARFRSAMVFLHGDTGAPSQISTEGMCYGVICSQPAGEQGFGYDPVFLLPELGKTFAELEPDIKNRISHRGNALSAFRERLSVFMEK